MEQINTTPDENRRRSYSGGYMRMGKQGQEFAFRWLRNLIKRTVRVEDLTQDVEMQLREIDARVHFIDGKEKTFEIKNDGWVGVSGKYCFEILRINHTAKSECCSTLGWSVKSEAEWLLIYARNDPENKIHLILMSDFRKAMQKYTAEARKDTEISYVSTDNIKSTVNILVPGRYIEEMPSFRTYSGGADDE